MNDRRAAGQPCVWPFMGKPKAVRWRSFRRTEFSPSCRQVECLGMTASASRSYFRFVTHEVGWKLAGNGMSTRMVQS